MGPSASSDCVRTRSGNAAPDQPLVQINAGFGGVAKWFEEVTVDQYAGKKR